MGTCWILKVGCYHVIFQVYVPALFLSIVLHAVSYHNLPFLSSPQAKIKYCPSMLTCAPHCARRHRWTVSPCALRSAHWHINAHCIAQHSILFIKMGNPVFQAGTTLNNHPQLASDHHHACWVCSVCDCLGCRRRWRLPHRGGRDRLCRHSVQPCGRGGAGYRHVLNSEPSPAGHFSHQPPTAGLSTQTPRQLWRRCIFRYYGQVA